MFNWKNLWCFYNSNAFNIVSKLALLGGFVFVVNALINIPQSRDLPIRKQSTPTIKFNNSRRFTILTGWITIILSVIPPTIYFFLFNTTDGQTCDVKVKVTENYIYLLLRLLYGSTIAVLISFGLFYIKRQETLKRDKDLGER